MTRLAAINVQKIIKNKNLENPLLRKIRLSAY